MEEWKDIVDFEGFYKISNNCKIISVKRNIVMKLKTDKDGYYCIGLRKNGSRKWFRVCRLVPIHFISNPSSLPVVNHKNGIKSDDRVENLEWVSYSENTKHSFEVLKRVGHNGGTNKRVMSIDIETGLT